MSSSPVATCRPSREAPVSLHRRAGDNLEFIRGTMERAGSFTAVSGWAGCLMGWVALLAASVAARQAETGAWLLAWLLAAALAVPMGLAAMAWKARATRTPLLSGPGRKFALSFSPPIAAAALLTLVFYRHDLISLLPGMWLLLYGTAVVAGGAFSVKAVPTMGAALMLLGAMALLVPFYWANLLLALGFGGLQIIFGIYIARHHGG